VVTATQSSRIRRIREEVLCRLPPSDRLAIEGFVRRLRGEQKWRTYAFGTWVDRRAVALLPLAARKSATRSPHAQLVFALPVCRLFSDAALTGLLAHALAHAVRAASRGRCWWRILEDHRIREDNEAEALATEWGFAPELHAWMEERVRVVLPRIEEHEERILTVIRRRASSRA
jgi:hypothetical protein